VFVQRVRQDIDEGGEGVGRSAHGTIFGERGSA
jgi:hypothetical protein